MALSFHMVSVLPLELFSSPSVASPITAVPPQVGGPIRQPSCSIHHPHSPACFPALDRIPTGRSTRSPRRGRIVGRPLEQPLQSSQRFLVAKTKPSEVKVMRENSINKRRLLVPLMLAVPIAFVGCGQGKTTPPGPVSSFGVVYHGAHCTYVKWEEGLTVMFLDRMSGHSGHGSSSTNDQRGSSRSAKQRQPVDHRSSYAPPAPRRPTICPPSSKPTTAACR